jgi:hypothetical protein
LHTNGLLALKKIDIFNSYDKASLSIASFNQETYFKVTGSRVMPDVKRITEMARGEIQTRGGVAETLRKYGMIRSVDMMLQFFLAFLVENIYFPKKLEFGITEALFCARPPYSIDWYCRNSSVAKEIRQFGGGKVLDVGGGRNGLLKFLHQNSHIYVVDIRKNAFHGHHKKAFTPILGDACHLPFKDNSFDVACGVSLLEHISTNHRTEALFELERVGNKAIVHLPVESYDGVYVGKKADLEFMRAHYRLFGFQEVTTAEHVKAGSITLDELKRIFPNAYFKGRKNYFIWLRYMLMSLMPFCFLTGFFYLFSWKTKDNQPPYYEVMILLKK